MNAAAEVRAYVFRFRSFSRNARLYLLSTILQGLGTGIWGVIFYLYLNLGEVGFKPDFISNMFTAGAIATGLVALPAGLMCELTGTRKAILVSFTSNLFSFMQIITLQPSILLLASLLSGLIGTIGWVASAPFMTENSRQEERTHLFSVSWTTMVIMGVVGSYLGGALPDIFNAFLGLQTGATIGSAPGYRATLVVATALTSAAVVPILLIKEDVNISRQKIGTLLGLRNIKNPLTLLKFMIPTGLIGFGAGFIVPLFNLFFKLRFAASAEQVGAIFALGNITLGAGTLVAPALSNRLGKVKTVVICEYLSMPFIMLMTVSPSLTYASGAFLIRGALMNMAGPVGTAFQMETVAQSERATSSGLVVMADNIPRAITASISGRMMTGSDFFTPFLFTTVTYFVASTLYLIFFGKAGKKQEQPRTL